MLYRGKVVSTDSNKAKVRIQALHNNDLSDDSLPYALVPESVGEVSQGDVVQVDFEGSSNKYPTIVSIISKIKNSMNNLNSKFSGLCDYVLYDGTPKSLAEIASAIIFGNEGNYETVAGNDNGAISIGKIQWHGNRAKSLLRSILNANSDKIKNICSTNSCSDLITMITDNSSWENFTISDSSAYMTTIKSILTTDESHSMQDDLAMTDVAGYIGHGKERGITLPSVLIYYADLENQYGYGGANKFTTNDNCKSSLDAFYRNSLSVDGRFETRRTRTYNKIKELELQGKLIPCNNDQTSNPNSGAFNCKALFPIAGYENCIVSNYGDRITSSGINIVRKETIISSTDISGKQVVASLNGEVQVNDNPLGYYGKYVDLYVRNKKYLFRYCNLNNISVSNGSQVKAGDIIGTVGNTGTGISSPSLSVLLLNSPFNFGTSIEFGNCIDPKPYLLGLSQLKSTCDDIVNWVRSKVGCGYSKKFRFSPNMFDCSSLVSRAFLEYGITFSDSTAAGECKELETSSMGTSIGLSSSSWQPADLLFYSFESNGRYKNISHVAVYVGDGRIVEAADEEQGVREGNVYTSGLVSVCRVNM